MKKITAIIKPFKLDDVRESLSAKGISGMTVSGRAFSLPQPDTRIRLTIQSVMISIFLFIIILQEQDWRH